MMNTIIGKKGKVLLVLGMHRSGTSCLTGLLQQAGLVLGDVIEEAPHNKKGNREHPAVMQLNNAVLAFNDAAWDKPQAPDKALGWNDALEQQRDQFIGSMAGHKLWGCKDPRMLMVLPFWLQGLNRYNVNFIGTFRHPLSVALSLQARQPDMSLEKGLMLWRRYNEILIQLYEKHRFPVVDFDSDNNQYLQQVRTAIERTGLLQVTGADGWDFFDDSLRHQTLPDSQLQGESATLINDVMPLYSALKACVP